MYHPTKVGGRTPAQPMLPPEPDQKSNQIDTSDKSRNENVRVDDSVNPSKRVWHTSARKLSAQRKRNKELVRSIERATRVATLKLTAQAETAKQRDREIGEFFHSAREASGLSRDKVMSKVAIKAIGPAELREFELGERSYGDLPPTWTEVKLVEDLPANWNGRKAFASAVERGRQHVWQLWHDYHNLKHTRGCLDPWCSRMQQFVA